MKRISREELLKFKEVTELIEKNTVTIDSLGQVVEDEELFLQIISGIKKMKKLKQPDNKKQNCKQKSHNFTELQIRNIIYQKDWQLIQKEFKKEDLIDMYVEIYKNKPLAKAKKENIYCSIKDYFKRKERVDALDI